MFQIKIEGFDPAKFRAANGASVVGVGQEKSRMGLTDSGPGSGLGGGLAVAPLVPGSVPTYDPMEQQLLASLEQELGV